MRLVVATMFVFQRSAAKSVMSWKQKSMKPLSTWQDCISTLCCTALCWYSQLEIDWDCLLKHGSRGTAVPPTFEMLPAHTPGLDCFCMTLFSGGQARCIWPGL